MGPGHLKIDNKQKVILLFKLKTPSFDRDFSHPAALNLTVTKLNSSNFFKIRINQTRHPVPIHCK